MRSTVTVQFSIGVGTNKIYASYSYTRFKTLYVEWNDNIYFDTTKPSS